MKLQEIFYFIVIFNLVMALLANIGFAQITGTFEAVDFYTKAFGIGIVVGIVGSLGAAATSSFIRENKLERTVAYGAIVAIFFGLFETGFATFRNLFGQYPIFLSILVIIEVVVGMIMMLTLYQTVFGGWGSYE